MSASRESGNSISIFLILTFGLAFLTWGIMAVFQLPGASTDPQAPPPSVVHLVLFILGGFSPSIAGILTALLSGGRKALKDLFRRSVRFSFGLKYYLFIALVPVVIFAFRLGLHALRGGEFLDSALLAQPVSFVGFTIQILFLGPLSEEFGWRGVALDSMLYKLKTVRSSLILGAVWAVWHLPLFFIPGTAQNKFGNPVAEFVIFAAGVVGMTVVFTWLYIGTNRSLASAVLYHFTYNFAISLLATLMDGGIVDRIVNSGVQVAIALVIIVIGGSRSAKSAVM